ncbi:hypothetical protein ACIA98_21640 [Streptomyces sp. NPDC051366]|uniref:hypothetical protein n=1 Tax=Streptomyces sp. NPDC051366 TaxID=3365652 RepID=UPI0037AFE46D
MSPQKFLDGQRHGCAVAYGQGRGETHDENAFVEGVSQQQGGVLHPGKKTRRRCRQSAASAEV